MPGYHLPYFTAEATGLYAKHGLEVEIVHPEPGPDNIEAAAAGKYDFCLTSVAHFLRAVTERPGLAARFVFMIARHTHMGVFYARGRRGASGRSIESLSDLAGASFVGDPESPFTREYAHLMRRVGAPEPAIVEMPYGDVPEALALGKGDVTGDYVDLLPDYQTTGRAHGVQVAALPFHSAGVDIYGSGLVCGSNLIESRPEVVDAVVSAVKDALATTRSNPEKGAGALLGRYPEAGMERTLASWRASEELIFLEDGRALGEMDSDKWARTIGHHADVHGTARVDAHSVYADFP